MDALIVRSHMVQFENDGKYIDARLLGLGCLERLEKKDLPLHCL